MGQSRLPARIRRQLYPGEARRPKRSNRQVAQNGKLPRQSEKSFQAQVVEYATQIRHWRVYHTWNSEHSAAGFPDLVLVRRPRVVWAELKRDGEQPTPDQQGWIDELRACGQEVYAWRPADFQEIVRVLS